MILLSYTIITKTRNITLDRHDFDQNKLFMSESRVYHVSFDHVWDSVGIRIGECTMLCHGVHPTPHSPEYMYVYNANITRL